MDAALPALARAAARKHLETPRFVGMLRLPGGYTTYSRGNPNVARLTGREEGAIHGISYEFWEDDNSTDFARTYARVEREGSFTERTGSG